MSTNDIEAHFASVKSAIQQAEATCHREEQVKLMAVSKTKPIEMIQKAYALGQRDFGENYVQESLEKIQALSDLKDICWHFIGSIQSNKTRDIATHFDWVHSVNRLKIAQRLNDQRPDSLPPLNICLELNISNESTKSGMPLKELPSVIQHIADMPRLTLRGLMVIPAPETDPDRQRIPFHQAANVMKQLNHEVSLDMDTLSMGTTADYQAAITEGATIIRVGTALFGPRDYSQQH
ncbi:hypothetical protein CI610_01892 [invertebrate metagenome]|uniref:Alanine racemase N-terminal domain-containing protein n=1 Tax=invertebrate metagenome TaxID=1711999 RepID=A0A2H9T7F2_9ZZZZ